MKWQLNKQFVLIAMMPVIFIGVGYDAFAETHWHPGMNLQQGDYFRYSFCHVDYHECRNVDLQILVVDETPEDWFVKLIMTERTVRTEGFLELSKDQIRFSGSDQTMERFANLFNNSLVWLAEFSSVDEPKDLTVGEDWGLIGNIGGESIGVLREETVMIDSKILESAVLGWKSSGTSNHIWIADGFPFPIRSNIFIHVPVYPPQPWTDYVLVKHGSDFQGTPSLIFPPLEQVRYGVTLDNVVCINNLVLVLKNTDGVPACVTLDTKNKLVERGWIIS